MLVWGSMWGRTVCIAAVAWVVGFIKGLGLEASLERAKALWVCSPVDLQGRSRDAYSGVLSETERSRLVLLLNRILNILQLIRR